MSRLHRVLAASLSLAVVLGVAASCGDDSADTSADAASVDVASADTVVDAATSSTTQGPDVAGTTTSLAPRADAATFAYTIPPGTADRIDAGEPVEVLPERLDVKLGDHITIDNQDAQNHVIGPFYVAANDTLEYTFVSAGSFSGACSAHASGEILVVVT